MKKIYLLLSLVLIITLVGCGSKKEEPKKNEEALKFKSEYEGLNGKTNKSGKVHRTISIPENNPFEEITPEDLLKKFDTGETFYVFFGSPICPWCRSVIESAIKIADERDIIKIYYVDIWDDNGDEILRSKYEVKDGKASKLKDGTETYYKLVDKMKDFLRDYTLTDGDKTIEVGEKRIYAPNFVYVKDGKTKKLITGKSEKQTDSRGELTDEIKKEQEESFKRFFE